MSRANMSMQRTALCVAADSERVVTMESDYAA